MISIGVTTYRRPELLQECLRSILEQQFGDFEVLIGNDDVSGPLSLEQLGIRDPRVRLINRPKNLGELGNMNALLSEGRGENFTWLADDDLFCPGFLGGVSQALKSHPGLKCVFSSYASGEKYGEVAAEPIQASAEILKGREFLRRYLRLELKALGCYGVWDTEYLRSIGGMEKLGSGFSPYSDSLLVIRAGALPEVGYLAAPLIFFRTHPQSISNSSADIEAYMSAQRDFCERCLEVFRIPELNEDFDANLYQLLSHWCIEHFYSVLGRSRSLHLEVWGKYLRFVAGYARLLHGDRILLGARGLWNLRLLVRARVAFAVRGALRGKMRQSPS
ncbi:MAG: glycosyltransferase family 2 protein [Bdellovibrionota bacterium]